MKMLLFTIEQMYQMHFYIRPQNRGGVMFSMQLVCVCVCVRVCLFVKKISAEQIH